MWPAKAGVYVRGAQTRETGQVQLNRIAGGARYSCPPMPTAPMLMNISEDLTLLLQGASADKLILPLAGLARS